MKLGLKHIASYFPYGLKVHHTDLDEEVTITTEIVMLSQDCIGFNDGCDYYFNPQDMDESNPIVKPILRPLSDLTKEIDGVVGIVELAKIAAEYWGVDFDVDKISPFGNGVLSKDGHEFGFTGLEFYFLDDEEGSIEINQLTYFEYLFAHHYDVHGLIEQGLAVDKESILKLKK